MLGLETRGVVASPLPGPAGNVEYFIWLHKPADVPGGMSAAADKVGDRSAPVSAQPVGPEIMAMIVARSRQALAETTPIGAGQYGWADRRRATGAKTDLKSR